MSRRTSQPSPRHFPPSPGATSASTARPPHLAALARSASLVSPSIPPHAPRGAFEHPPGRPFWPHQSLSPWRPRHDRAIHYLQCPTVPHSRPEFVRTFAGAHDGNIGPAAVIDASRGPSRTCLIRTNAAPGSTTISRQPFPQGPSEAHLKQALTRGQRRLQEALPFRLVDKYRKRFIYSIIAGAGSAALSRGRGPRSLKNRYQDCLSRGGRGCRCQGRSRFSGTVLFSPAPLLPIVIILRCLSAYYLENY